MIANITKGNFLKPLLEYNENKVNKKEATLLSVQNAMTNSKGENGYENAIHRISELGYSSKRKDKFFHVSINFPESDKIKLDDNLLNQIAADYMEQIGFRDLPFIVYKHDDTNHPHIHIICSNINEQKKAIVTSNDRIISQKITRDLEIKYGLTIVSSEKKQISNVNKKTNFTSLNEELNFHLKFALQVYRVQTLTELQNYLNNINLDVQVLKGVKELSGKKTAWDGVVFNKLDNDFKQNQKGIKASSLYLKPTLNNLEKAFIRNISFHKSNRKVIRNQIDYSLSSYDKIKIEDLQRKLLLKNIELNVKYDSNSNLVGLSFIDTKTGYKYTGEQIGKNYTAKNIRSYIGSKTELKPTVLTTINFKKYQEKIEKENLNINQKLQTLIYLGFKVHYDKNSIFISDYKNKTGEGYIKLYDSININASTIELYKNSKNIKFNDLSEINKLHFEYNRNKFDNNIEKLNDILFKIDQINNPKENGGFNKERNVFVQEYLDNLYQDIYNYQSDDNQEHFSISDIDKKKKRGPKRKR